jgi:S-adenosylmethionine hydrolase
MAVIHSRPIVTLTTDFGGGSPYVAQMKGVLLSRNPELQLVDITHDIPPQDIRAGALVVDDVCRRFPPRTIHIVVVDPGVGTERDVVFVRTGQQRYVAPNNGVLTLAAQRLPPDQIIAVTNRLYFLPEVWPTFHGRDVMAPVAAHLSLGLQPERLGSQLSALVTLPLPIPRVEAERIVGSVLQVDSFGNVITNITTQHLVNVPATAGIRVRIRDAEVAGLVRTYGDDPPGKLVALIGSAGRLELAIVNGNASGQLRASVDDEVIVVW